MKILQYPFGRRLVIGLTACTTDPNSPGVEYMPDMYRSPAIEAYVDYGQEPYEVGEEVARAQRNTPSSRKPVPGTIPFRGEDQLAFALPYAFGSDSRGL